VSFASEERLREVPWAALAGIAPALDAPLAAVLANAPAERVVDRFLRAQRTLGSEQRLAVKEAIYGVAVWRRRLAWHASGAPRLLLAALLRDLGGIPDAEALLGLPVGALPPPHPPPDDPALRFSFPDWLWATLQREAGGEAPALAGALNLPAPVALRPNLLRTTPEALAARLAAEGVATREGWLVPSARVVTSPRPNLYGLAAEREGLFEVQDEASQLVGALVAARPGETVLDLCAGAGGKALQLAAAVGAGGSVHAADPDLARLERLRARAARAGAASIVRVHGAAPPPELQVDAALVDAPCSELGVLRRGPDRRFHLDPACFDAFPPLQRRILAAAACHVRPGGRLVYATCTLRREENEEVALAFEGEHPAFARDGEFQRTWPHRGGWDGFFVAAWRRV
jgi:16S rRNA (cytosine967-C5)-methyltransferase